jgi:hypothetical protein
LDQRPLVISLSRLSLHQTSIKRKRGENRKFRDSSLKEQFSDFYPQILQVDPYRTNHCATVAIGAKVNALLKIPEFTFFQPSARSQCLNGSKLFGRENIDVRNPFKSDTNRATRGAHSTMGTGVQFHQLNHG